MGPVFSFRPRLRKTKAEQRREVATTGRSAAPALLLSLILLMTPALPAGAAWLGITIQDDVTAEGSRRDVKVLDAGRDSPGSRAGIRAGDVIVSANGVPISTSQEFVRIIRETPAAITNQTTPSGIFQRARSSTTSTGCGTRVPRGSPM